MKGYSKTPDKNRAWEEIASSMSDGLTGTDLQELWGKLRVKFGKERRKVVDSMPRSGAGAAELANVYKSDWFLYDNLTFLENHIQARRTVSNVPSPGSGRSSPASPSFAGGSSILVKPATVRSASPSVCGAKTTPVKFVAVPSPLTSPSSASSPWDQEVDSIFSSSNDEAAVASPEMPKQTETAGTPSSLRASAAQIIPAKKVPPGDIVNKRKRNADVERDSIKKTDTAISNLASSLTGALERFAVPQTPPPPTAPATSVPDEVAPYVGAICGALQKVPSPKLVMCVIEMLQVANKYSTES